MKTIKLDPPATAAALFVAVAMLFGAVGIASAATFTDVEFENGDTEIQGKGGKTVEATLRVVVDDGEVVERIEVDNNYNAPTCVKVGGTKGLEEGVHQVDVDVKLPPNTGEYDLDVSGSGIYGASKAIDCEDNVVGSESFSDALIVEGAQVDDDNDENGGLQSQIEALTALVAKLMGGGTVAPAGKCAVLSQKLSGATPGVNTNGNVVLQGYLLGEGASIPALAGGAAFGFFGSQTQAAIQWFKSVNTCS